MKPRTLTLHNIGPFAGKTVIRFDELGDIFLICGKTGSGKTTIFDSLTYALYGKLPGARSQQIRMIRSQFAREGEECFVDLVFTVREKTYRITRRPPASQISTRTGAVRERPEEAELSIRQGNEWMPLAAKITDVYDRVIEIIGLLPEEFSRIVLLPQGEFAEFLRQNSNQRRQSLSKLFPVELYSTITERAARMETIYRDRLRDTESRIQSLADEFSAETWKEDSEALQNEIAESKKELERLGTSILTLARSIESSRQLCEFERQRLALTRDLEELDLLSTEMEAAERQLRRSLEAEKLLPALTQVRQARERKTGADELCNQCAETLQENREELASLETEKPEVERKSTRQHELEFQRKELDRGIACEKRLRETEETYGLMKTRAESLRQSAGVLTAKLAKLDTESAGDVIPASVMEDLAAKDTKANDELAEARKIKEIADRYAAAVPALREAEEAFDRAAAKRQELENAPGMLRQEIAELEAERTRSETGQRASELAKELKEGSPCPVCGSLHHPEPAREPDGTWFTIGERLATKKRLLETAEKEKQDALFLTVNAGARRDTARANAREIEARYADISGNEELPPAPEEAASRVARAAAAKQESRNALDAAYRSLSRREQADKERAQMQTQLARVRAELEGAAADEAAAAAEKTQLERQIADIPGLNGSISPSARAAELEKEFAEISNYIEDFRTKMEKAASQKSALAGRAQELEKARTSAERERAGAEQVLSDKLRGSGFSGEAELENALMGENEKKDHTARREEWLGRMAEKKTLLRRAERELEGKDIPDIGAQEAELEKLKTAQETETERASEAASKLSSLNDRKKRWDELEEERSSLARESSLYVRLSEDLSGRNPKNRSFEAWALARYLEEITLYASRRLERMSEGRYRLLLNSEKMGRQRYSGLDLEIFDAYTGKKRPCETLSGGETFMASISLALALTDAVQNRSGGIRLDALFIDEGFGSLDETTLEKALTILDEIRGSRMVGLISHVPELRNRIPVRIEVTKTSAGSTISIEE